MEITKQRMIVVVQSIDRTWIVFSLFPPNHIWHEALAIMKVCLAIVLIDQVLYFSTRAANEALRKTP